MVFIQDGLITLYWNILAIFRDIKILLQQKLYYVVNLVNPQKVIFSILEMRKEKFSQFY